MTSCSKLQKKHGIDPWFEFMKRLQQYPEEDPTHLKGTSIIDWTQNFDVAIYFANDSRDGDGALWICDATATGKTLQVITGAEILKKMEQSGREDASLGVPLIFHPKKQLIQKRAVNQQPVYVAQMDLRVDFSEVWDNLQGHERSENIFVKLILPHGIYEPFSQYLNAKGITREFLFPE